MIDIFWGGNSVLSLFSSWCCVFAKCGLTELDLLKVCTVKQWDIPNIQMHAV